MKLLKQKNDTTRIEFNFEKLTLEKVRTRENCYRHELLRKTPCKIVVIFNTKDRTMQVHDKVYKIHVSNGYVYKKLQGYNIGCSYLDYFIKHIEEAANRENVFHISMKSTLLNWSKNKFTYLN
jgi:hypothetical protein